MKKLNIVFVLIMMFLPFAYSETLLDYHTTETSNTNGMSGGISVGFNSSYTIPIGNKIILSIAGYNQGTGGTNRCYLGNSTQMPTEKPINFPIADYSEVTMNTNRWYNMTFILNNTFYNTTHYVLYCLGSGSSTNRNRLNASSPALDKTTNCSTSTDNVTWNNDVFSSLFKLYTNYTDTTYNSVTTFINSTPSNIDIFNAVSNTSTFYYNITSIYSINSSQIYYKINYNDSSCWIFINGSCIYNNYAIQNATFIKNTSSTNYIVKYELDDNDIYPSLNILNYDLFENTTHTAYLLSSNPDLAGCYLRNISNNKEYSFIEIMANSSTGSANFYACNNSYTSGLIGSSPFCALIGSSGVTPSYNHCHKSSLSCHNVYTILINTSRNTIGNVYVTDVMQFYIKSIASSDWNIYSIPQIAYTGACKISSNGGNSFSSYSGSFNIHVHQYNGSEIFQYYNNVTTNTEKNIISSVRTDSIEILPLAPTPSNILIPTTDFYYNSINISWNSFEFSAPYSKLSMYNLSLLNSDFSLNSTIGNTTNTYLNYDISTKGSGYFYIKVIGIDNNSLYSFSLSDIFYIDNDPPYFVSYTPLDNESYYKNSTIHFYFECYDINLKYISMNITYTNFSQFNESTTSNNLSVYLYIGDYSNVTYYITCNDTYFNTTKGITFFLVNKTIPKLPTDLTSFDLQDGFNTFLYIALFICWIACAMFAIAFKNFWFGSLAFMIGFVVGFMSYSLSHWLVLVCFLMNIGLFFQSVRFKR